MVSSHHGAKIKSHSEVHFTALTWKGQILTYGYLRLVRLRFICFAMCRGIERILVWRKMFFVFSRA